MLWAAERNADSITTVAAATILSLAAQTNSQDEFGMEVLMAGRQMAERLGLMNLPRDSARSPYFNEMSPQWVRATSHVAWGTYNYFS